MDGKAHAPHLRTIRDGWRTLRFFLLYSPRWLFLVPGLGLLAAGAVGYALALPGATISGVTFDAHTLLVASLAALLGSQLLQFAVFAKTFAISEGLMPEGRLMRTFNRCVNLERGLAVGLASFVVGGGLLFAAVDQVALCGFRRARLRTHDAVGHSRRHARRPGLSDDVLKLLHQHPSHGAQALGSRPWRPRFYRPT